MQPALPAAGSKGRRIVNSGREASSISEGRASLDKNTGTVLKIVEDRLDFTPDVLPEALAEAEIREFAQPVNRRVVYSLSYIEAQIKSSMICTSEDHHDFAGFVLDLGYF